MANMKNKKNPNPEHASSPKRAKPELTDNAHQKTVSGKSQSGPDDKRGKTGGGNQATRQNASRGGSSGNATENARSEQTDDDRG
jgi:hypothetical protein